MMLYLETMATMLFGRLTDKRERGASAVEYGLLIAGIAVAIIVIVFTLGDQIAAMFTQVSDKLPAA